VVVPAFENVSLYNVFGEILGVSVPENDGDPAIVPLLLR
jgi:hypothetical protein